MNELISRIQAFAVTMPDAIALRAEQRQVSYAQLVDLIKKRANDFRQQPQKLVLLDQTEPIDWVIDDLALLLADKVSIPVPPFFSDKQRSYLYQRVAANQALPRGTVKVTFTSGSTGEPKGVCLSIDNQIKTVKGLAARVGSLGVKRHLVVMPLAILLENVAGVYLSLWLGAEVVLFNAATLGLRGSSELHTTSFYRAIRRAEADSMILTPALLHAVVEGVATQMIDGAAFKLLAVGGAALSATLQQRVKHLKLPVAQGYGLSEFSSVVAFDEPMSVSLHTVGRPLQHAEVMVDNGEIVVSGNTMLGYWDEPDSWQQARIRTGDLGQFDDDGKLIIQGRRKHILVTAYGRNVDPEWIEAELCSHEAIQQAFVWGNEDTPLTALIVLANGSSCRPSDAEILQTIAQVNRELPDYARLHRHRVISQPFSVANGFLTGTGRLRRCAILTTYQSLCQVDTNSSVSEVYNDVL